MPRFRGPSRAKSDTLIYAHTHAPHAPVLLPPTTNPSRQQDARWGLESDLFLRKWNQAGVVAFLVGRGSSSRVKAAGAGRWVLTRAHNRHTLRLLDFDSITWSDSLYRERSSPDLEVGLSLLGPLYSFQVSGEAQKKSGSSSSPDCRSQRFEVLTLDKRLLVGE